MQGKVVQLLNTHEIIKKIKLEFADIKGVLILYLETTQFKKRVHMTHHDIRALPLNNAETEKKLRK